MWASNRLHSDTTACPALGANLLTQVREFERLFTLGDFIQCRELNPVWKTLMTKAPEYHKDSTSLFIFSRHPVFPPPLSTTPSYPFPSSSLPHLLLPPSLFLPMSVPTLPPPLPFPHSSLTSVSHTPHPSNPPAPPFSNPHTFLPSNPSQVAKLITFMQQPLTSPQTTCKPSSNPLRIPQNSNLGLGHQAHHVNPSHALPQTHTPSPPSPIPTYPET